MRTRLIRTLLVALLLALASSPAALAQGDGPIEPVTTPDATGVTPPAEGDGPIGEEAEDGELPIGAQPPVEPTGPWRVEVDCAFAPAAGTTACAFTGVPPAGQAGPVVFVVPAELVCSGVTGGQYAYVAPDPATGLNGFRPIGDAGWLTLDLAGVVTPTGAGTYWFQAPEGIVPGTGPALACAPAPPAREPTPVPTPTPVATTGTLTVRTLTCADVPEDRAGYDWFGACEPIAYELSSAEAQVTPPPEPRVEAEAVFDDVPPGGYDLEAMGFTWCHAVSDNVTPEGSVVVETGARTTVWIFLCDGA